MPLKIAIVGAGPAGCLLARLLQQSKKDISVTVFESEGSLDFRSQGGTLDLHVKTGQAALKAAGLYDEFLKYARYDGEAMKMADKNLLCYITQSGSSQNKAGTGRPEIDRPRLRELLFNSLAADTVKWNHKLKEVDQDLNLHLANGNVEGGFDLVVGADGAWSRARARLTDVKPYYSGIGGYALSIPDAQKTQPELHALVNHGSLFTWSDGKSIMAQQMGDGSINVGTWAVQPEDWQSKSAVGVHDAKALKKSLRESYAGWDSRLVAFTQVADDHIVARDLFMLPVGTKWDHVKGLTLLGDAAHLMTPFAGEGVNTAFADCMELAEAIAATAKLPESAQKAALDDTVISYEESMFKRAKDVQSLTYDMMSLMFFVAGAPRTTIAPYITRAVEGEFGWWITRVVLMPIIYTYFTIFKMIW